MKLRTGWAAALCGLVLIVARGDLRGQENPGLTIDQCIEMSLAQNPLWLSSEEDYRASLAGIERAKAFPQPSLEFDSDLQPRAMSFRGAGESYFGVSQTVEFPGRRLIRAGIARLESREALAERNVLRGEIVYGVKEAFYGVLLAEEKRKYAAQDLELADDFLQKADVKHASGDVAKVEAVRARLEASKAATALTTAENDVLLAKARLNFFLGRSRSDPLEIRGGLSRKPVSVDIDALMEKAMIQRPEITGMNARLERGSKVITQAGMTYLPDFDLALSRHRIEGLKPTWDFRLSVTVPLFFWQPLRGDVAEARARRRSLERQSDNLANLVKLEVEEAVMKVREAENRISLFQKDILNQAEEVYNLFLFSFQEGEIGGIELIEARRTLIESRKAYADALYDYTLTLAALEKAVGGVLEGDNRE